MSSTDIDEIGRRWKVRYHTQIAAAPTLQCPTAPDTRTAMLRLRADLLRREPRLSNTKRVEDELSETIEEVIEERKHNEELKQECQWLRDELTKAQRQQQEEEKLVAELQKELAEVKDVVSQQKQQIDSFEQHVQQQQKQREVSSTAGENGSQRGAAPGASGRSSPAMTASRASSFRSPARYGTGSPTRRSAAGTAIAPQRTSSPGRPAFKI